MRQARQRHEKMYVLPERLRIFLRMTPTPARSLRFTLCENSQRRRVCDVSEWQAV